MLLIVVLLIILLWVYRDEVASVLSGNESLSKQLNLLPLEDESLTVVRHPYACGCNGSGHGRASDRSSDETSSLTERCRGCDSDYQLSSTEVDVVDITDVYDLDFYGTRAAKGACSRPRIIVNAANRAGEMTGRQGYVYKS